MRVISHRLYASSGTGLAVTVNEALRNPASDVMPAGRHAQRLLLKEFPKVWPHAKGGDPALLSASEILLPGLDASALSRVKAALRKPYDFSKRAVSQDRSGLVTIQSPQPFLCHDVLCITLMTGVKRAKFATQTSRLALLILLSGKRALEATISEIDNYMK